MPGPHLPSTYRLLALVGAATAALLIAGCGGADSSTSETAATTPDTSTQVVTDGTGTTATGPSSTDQGTAAHDVTVYFMNLEATGLVAEERTADASTPLRAALVALADGPEGADGMRALPAGTAIVGTDVRSEAAYVNLNQAFLDGYPSGGAAAESAVLGPLVYTVTEAAGVERVYVTVDGQTVTPTGSQYDWASGFTRSDFPDLSISGG